MKARFVSLIPLFVSAVFIWLGWGYYSKAQQSMSWPETAGTIIESKLIESRERSNGSTKYMYEARVAYDYEVRGQRYRGHQVGFMDGRTSSRSSAEEVVKQYPAGQAATVHYNPKDPQEACLDRSVGMAPMLMMGGGTLGMLLGGKLLLFGGRVRVRKNISHI